MQARIIEWDGTNVPEELRQLPPGRYIVDAVENMEDLDDLTPEEKAGLEHAFDEAEAGNVVPYDVAMRELRSRLHPR